MNLQPTLQKLYPDGTIGPGTGKYQGECVEFCHALSNFGTMGDTFAEKKVAFNNYGGTLIAQLIGPLGMGFRIGDCVLASYGVTDPTKDPGHMFWVAGMDDVFLYAAESNFSLDRKIHYGRKIAKTDPKLYGVIRAPLKIDLGPCNFNMAVFINNQPKWNLKIFDDIAAELGTLTAGKFQVKFFPLMTKFQNWWYEDFPFNGADYKVIAKSYLDQQMSAYSFTNLNKPADACLFLINPLQWQGTVTGPNVAAGSYEFAWTSAGKPGQIQAACAEFDLSPWYFGTRLVQHLTIHEISHYLHYINGLNDPTDPLDYPPSKQLGKVYNDIDFNRVIANL